MTLILIILNLFLVPAAARAIEPQELDWVYRYNGPGTLSNSDIGKGICMGPDGRIYSTGQASVSGDAGYSDIVVTCLKKDGTEEWVFLYDGGGFDMGYDITSDDIGNIYVAATSVGNGGNYDFAVLGLTSEGDFRWIYTYDPAGDIGFANQVVVGTDGNIYACGNAVVEVSKGTDATVVSLTPAGEERWVRTFNGNRDYDDIAWGIASGDDGHLYLCGRIYESDWWGDFMVASLSADGARRWSYRYNGTANGEDDAEMVIVGGDGNVYAVGKSSEIGRSRDFTVISLTPGGKERWIYLYDGEVSSHDTGHCLAWGKDNNVYAGGKTVENDGDAFSIIGLTPEGGERWVFVPTWDGYNGVWSIATDEMSNVYAAGWIGEELPVHPYYRLSLGVASVTSGGVERWNYVYPGTDPFTGIADQVIYGGNGDVYVVGFSPDIAWQAELTVLKFQGPYRYDRDPNHHALPGNSGR